MEEEDRISQLPDAILINILSSIDIYEAVQTSILSKRWRHLCSFISQLNFNFNFHRLARRSPLNLRNSPRRAIHITNRFTHAVSHFLSRRHHSSALTKLRLSHYYRACLVQDPTFETRCISYALSHGVQHLDVHQFCTRANRFPDAFFACQTLRHLTLRRFGQFLMPRQFSLPNVTTLHVERSSFSYDDDVQSAAYEPFAGFPNLEKLTLRNNNFCRLIVAAAKLKTLEIAEEDNNFNDEIMARISAPLLTSFTYKGFFPLVCPQVELPSLENLRLECSRKLRRRSGRNMPLKCVRMLQQFGNFAKVVTLGLDTIEILEMDGGLLERSSSPFRRMNCLKLTKGHNVDDRMMNNTVLRGVMKYLTMGEESMLVEFPEGVYVVDHKIGGNMFDEDSGDEGQLEWLYKGDPYSTF